MQNVTTPKHHLSDPSFKSPSPSLRRLSSEFNPNVNWELAQSRYWDSLAPKYDALYQSRWSMLENSYVRRSLAWLKTNDPTRVLDLGCGTGLGYELLVSNIPNLEYHALDLSEAMLRQLAHKYPTAHTHCSSMDNLMQFAEKSFNICTLFFGAASYSPATATTLAQIKRVLVRGGKIHASYINGWSLRRAVKVRRGRLETYRTRGDRSATPVRVRTYRTPELRKIYARLGLSVDSVDTIGLTAGILELPILFEFGQYVLRLVPAGHLIQVNARTNG
jgi:ubiquinone/menaquinone biosynthesis C-methylase UbiE